LKRDLHVAVATPRGSREKSAFDSKLKIFIFSKSLLAVLTNYAIWASCQSTKALTAVIHDAATFLGIVLICGIIGILQIEQRGRQGRAKRQAIRRATALALGAEPSRRAGPLKAGSASRHQRA